MLGAGNDLAPASGWAFGGSGQERGGGEMLVLPSVVAPDPNTDTKEANELLSRPCPRRLGLTSVLPKAVCEHTPAIRLHWQGKSCSVKTPNFGKLKLFGARETLDSGCLIWRSFGVPGAAQVRPAGSSSCHFLFCILQFCLFPFFCLLDASCIPHPFLASFAGLLHPCPVSAVSSFS